MNVKNKNDIPCFPQDFVKLVAAGHILICIFMTSLHQVCVQTSFGTSVLLYEMSHTVIQPNKADHIIFSVVIHKSINSKNDPILLQLTITVLLKS